jgi:hypothetical protein
LGERELIYDPREEAVLYPLEHGVKVKVQRSSPTRVRVRMKRGDAYVPPETGDLNTSGFRDRLVALARERLGGDVDLTEELGLIAFTFEDDLKEVKKAAAEDDEQTNVPELAGSPYRTSWRGSKKRSSGTTAWTRSVSTGWWARAIVERCPQSISPPACSAT